MTRGERAGIPGLALATELRRANRRLFGRGVELGEQLAHVRHPHLSGMGERHPYVSTVPEVRAPFEIARAFEAVEPAGEGTGGDAETAEQSSRVEAERCAGSPEQGQDLEVLQVFADGADPAEETGAAPTHRTGYAGLSDLLAENAGSLRVDFAAPPDAAWPPVAREAADALHGAVREALCNVRKHAGTDTAVLLARPQQDGIELLIRDQGRGFDPGRHRSGFGLTHSVGSRLSEVGGHARVHSAVGAGTEVQLFVPAAPGDRSTT